MGKHKPKFIYIELDTDGEVVQIFYSATSIADKYSPGTRTRVWKVLNRVKGGGTLVRGHFWAKLPYKDGLTSYHLKFRAWEQVIDLRLRNLFRKISDKDIKKMVTKDRMVDLIERVSINFKENG